MTRKSRPITEFISVKRLLLTGFLAVMSLACNNESPRNSSSSAVESGMDDVKVESRTPVDLSQGITDDTAPEFLQHYAKTHSSNEVVVHTRFGDISIELFRNTPMHRANFIYLTDQNYFNGTWFYRVSPGHVIQAGNNDDPKTVRKRMRLGDYKIPSEIESGNLHVRGAVAAARTYYQNAEKKSNPYEFYIVIGKEYSPRELELLAEKEGFALSEAQKKAYDGTPGSPHLDGEHTVFGRVVSGLDVVERINQVKIDEGEWPLEIIEIQVEKLN